MRLSGPGSTPGSARPLCSAHCHQCAGSSFLILLSAGGDAAEQDGMGWDGRIRIWRDLAKSWVHFLTGCVRAFGRLGVTEGLYT